MPLKKDPLGGGTNANGTKNEMYCSRCYENGAFTNPEITVDQMQAIVREKLKGIGFPGFMAGFFTRKIPKLQRWKV